ncbi:DNA alkylation repair protein [Knoellia subterranea]|uniref:DNA alkylation repair protein n=1 Tax=Knoellia subterranea TaxID=184882 RepID=UPI000A06B617|nr:DNA alkylation repair protein [Knoellia subterranea]
MPSAHVCEDPRLRKAIGWALRQHALTEPAWVVEFVDRHTQRLAGQGRLSRAFG